MTEYFAIQYFDGRAARNIEAANPKEAIEKFLDIPIGTDVEKITQQSCEWNDIYVEGDGKTWKYMGCELQEVDDIASVEEGTGQVTDISGKPIRGVKVTMPDGREGITEKGGRVHNWHRPASEANGEPRQEIVQLLFDAQGSTKPEHQVTTLTDKLLTIISRERQRAIKSVGDHVAGKSKWCLSRGEVEALQRGEVLGNPQ